MTHLMNIDIMKKKWVGFFIILLIMIFGLIGRKIYISNIKKCHNLGIATIIKISTTRNLVGFVYEYNVNNKKYIEISKYKSIANIIGKKFPVLYQCNNPHHSVLLITPKDFNDFGYEFPDSLNWVLPLIDE